MELEKKRQEMFGVVFVYSSLAYLIYLNIKKCVYMFKNKYYSLGAYSSTIWPSSVWLHCVLIIIVFSREGWRERMSCQSMFSKFLFPKPSYSSSTRPVSFY